MADIGASILAKLKNKAKESNTSYQQCLQLFFQEEFLRRLSKSQYVHNLILKGGLFIRRKPIRFNTPQLAAAVIGSI